MANLKGFLETLVSGSEEHKWNGLAPDCVALIFVRYPESGGRSNLGQQALLCNQYPISKEDANEYRDRFPEPVWRYVGHVFSYQHPEGGTQFKEHPAADFGQGKWDQMLKVPVLGTGVTYWEKIVCRMTETSYDEYLALKRKAEVSWKEPGAEQAQGSVPSTGRMHSAQEVADSTMKRKMPDLPQHECSKPGNLILGFAPIDFDVMKLLIDRDASKEEIGAQIREWIRADAANNPNPAEPVADRLQAAVMTNNPFARDDLLDPSRAGRGERCG